MVLLLFLHCGKHCSKMHGEVWGGYLRLGMLCLSLAVMGAATALQGPCSAPTAPVVLGSRIPVVPAANSLSVSSPWRSN